MGRNQIDLITAKVGHATGASGYFKKVKLKDFYNQLLDEIKAGFNDWDKQTEIMSKLEDVGGLKYCPDELYFDILKQLVLIYIGEESYGQYRASRRVFYSNGATPIVYRILENEGEKIIPHLEYMQENNRVVKGRINNVYVLRRFENLLDIDPVKSNNYVSDEIINFMDKFDNIFLKKLNL